MGSGMLLSLSSDDLITLIQAQAEQIAALTARIGELEAKLAVPPKTPENSSLPPSMGQKPNLADRGNEKPRPGAARRLAEHPDQIIEALAAACPHCDHALSPADLPDIHALITSICRRSSRSQPASTDIAASALIATRP
jgi:hypothetical protein